MEAINNTRQVTAILKTDVAEHEIHLQQKCKWNSCFTQRVQPAKVVDVRFYKRDLASTSEILFA